MKRRLNESLERTAADHLALFSSWHSGIFGFDDPAGLAAAVVQVYRSP